MTSLAAAPYLWSGLCFWLKLKLYVSPIAQLRICRLTLRGLFVWHANPDDFEKLEEFCCSFPGGKEELLRIERWVREKLGMPRYEGRLAA